MLKKQNDYVLENQKNLKIKTKNLNKLFIHKTNKAEIFLF